MSLAQDLAVYVIVSGATPLSTLEAVLTAGVRTIQFREKRMENRELARIATGMLELCHRYGARFLVNDRVDLALVVRADGVHVGQEDFPAAEARPLLGPTAIIGVSCETEAEATRAQADGADYIGTGPIYATASKADAGQPYGPVLATRISGAVKLPVVGIGGIGPGTAAPVIAAGASGVAVISSVLNAPDPGHAAACLMAEVRAALAQRGER